MGGRVFVQGVTLVGPMGSRWIGWYGSDLFARHDALPRPSLIIDMVLKPSLIVWTAIRHFIVSLCI